MPQLKMLQHMTDSAMQKITVGCQNMTTAFDKAGNNYNKAVVLTSFDEEVMSVKGKSPFRYKVQFDGCQVCMVWPILVQSGSSNFNFATKNYSVKSIVLFQLCS